MKEFQPNELSLSMHQQLIKRASQEVPNLAKAAECMHAALEILEGHGLYDHADRLLQVMDKIGQSTPIYKSSKIQSLQQLMQAGITQRDLREFTKGNPIAVAKLNLVLRKLGTPDHEISKLLGPTNLMSEEDALKALNPNNAESLTGSPQEHNVMAARKHRKPGRPNKDPATRGLTPAKEVKNLLEHGHPLNVTMADDCDIDIPLPVKKDTLTKDDMESGFVELLDSDFDIDASDDELMEMEVKDDSLEVLEADVSLEDFEDERH